MGAGMKKCNSVVTLSSYSAGNRVDSTVMAVRRADGARVTGGHFVNYIHV